jgi:cytochrome c-type biogenesis protein CcmH/NrfG
MDASIIAVLFGLLIILIVFFAWIYKNMFVPKRIEELAELIRSGQASLAIRRLKEMVEKDERNSYTRYLLGEALFQDKNYQHAAMEFKQVIKLGKYDGKVKEVNVRKRLARIYKLLNSLEEAKKEYLILTKIDSGDFQNFYQVGAIFFNAGLNDKALNYLKQALKLNGKHASSLYLAGQLSYLSNKLSDAKEYLVQAVKIKPEMHKAHYFLGMTLRAFKEHDWAIQEFEIAQKDKELFQKACLARGCSMMERNAIPKAMVEFQRGLSAPQRETETDLNLRYFLAACAERQRDLFTAITQWEKITESRPNFRDVPEKLKSYSEFRTDDTVKDFMIASPTKFETISRQMIENLGLTIVDLTVDSDTQIEAIGTVTQGKWRNTKKSNQLIRIIRATDASTEENIRDFHEKMREKSATRGILISTGDYSPGAVDFAQSRPINLVEKSQVIQMLQSVQKEMAKSK